MLVQANSTKIPLADNSVYVCVTSPPYFGLRSYLKDDDPLKSYELGAESLLAEYVTRLVTVFEEVRRVLRPDGVCWLNLGDGYANGSWSTGRRSNVTDGLKPKDLIGAPWRVAFALQDAGWYLRAACPWVKANSKTESCTDRPGLAHEYVFMLTKSKRYYFDMDAVRVPKVPCSISRERRGVSDNHKNTNGAPGQPPHTFSQKRSNDPGREVEAGRHLRTSDFFNTSLDEAITALVTRQAQIEAEIAALRAATHNGGMAAYGNDPLAFLVNAKGYRGAHFATMPAALVVPMIKAGPLSVCSRCGAPHRRVIKRTGHVNNREPAHVPGNCQTKTDSTGWQPDTRATNEWQPTCHCHGEPPTVPAVVIDPFCGSGTVGEVARQLGRRFVGLDLNATYLAYDALPRSEKKTSEAALQFGLFAHADGNEASE